MFGRHFGSHGGSHYIRKAQQSMIKLETLQSLMPILKFYYIDIIVGFMLFFGGLGIGIGLGIRIKEIQNGCN